jgi:hypothetical protein
MLNTKNTEKRKEMDLGALTLNRLWRFPTAVRQKFAAGVGSGGERRRESSRGSARQKGESER